MRRTGAPAQGHSPLEDGRLAQRVIERVIERDRERERERGRGEAA